MKAGFEDPIEQLNSLMQGPAGARSKQARWHRYFDPVPGLSAGLPVPILGIMVLIWQLRGRELQQKFPLIDAESRLGFIAWCLVHGGREYQGLREASAFWQALAQPATFGTVQLTEDDPGRCISWLMLLMMRERPDLHFDVRKQEGRRELLSWFLLYGQSEMPFVQSVFQSWQTDWLFKPSSEPGLSRFHLLVYGFLPSVREAFPLPTRRVQYLAWLRQHFCEKTKLVENMVKHLIDAPAPEIESGQLQQGVNLIGYVYGQLGIGEDVRMAGRSLAAASVPFAMLDFAPGKEVPQCDRSMESHVCADPVYSTNLFCMTALEQGRHFAERGTGTVAGRYNIGYWPWELPKFPRPWQHLLALVDEVWVSTDYTCASLEGVSPVRVRVMPMAVQLSKPSARTRSDFGLPPKAKLFIFSFDLNSSAKRKNPLACLEAFRKAFPLKGKSALGPDQVGLVIKLHPPAGPDADWEMLQRIKADDPRIHLIAQTLSTADLMAMYKACDCFISLHRAEGFGRGIAEAMLLGKPVIVTGFSGNLQFTRPDNALLVKYRLIPLLQDDYVHAGGQVWAEPEIEDAVQKMRQVFADASAIASLAKRGRDAVDANHGVLGVGKHYEAVLREQGRISSSAARRSKAEGQIRRRSALAT